MGSQELSMKWIELVIYAFKNKRFPGDMKRVT